MKLTLDKKNDFDTPGLTDRNIHLEGFKSPEFGLAHVCVYYIPKVVDFVTDINLPIIS